MDTLDKLINGIPARVTTVGCVMDSDIKTQIMLEKQRNLLNKITKKFADSVCYIWIRNIYSIRAGHSYSQIRSKVMFKNGYVLSIVWNGPDLSYGASDLLFECACIGSGFVLTPLKESISKEYYCDEVIGYMNDTDVMNLAKYIIENGDEIKEEAAKLYVDVDPYDIDNLDLPNVQF